VCVSLEDAVLWDLGKSDTFGSVMSLVPALLVGDIEGITCCYSFFLSRVHWGDATLASLPTLCLYLHLYDTLQPSKVIMATHEYYITPFHQRILQFSVSDNCIQESGSGLRGRMQIPTVGLLDLRGNLKR